jgi:DNA processing protein
MDMRRISRKSPEWATGLNSTWQPPSSLYIRGTLPRGPAVAVVGTRRMTEYGRTVVQMLVPELVRLGRTVVSGLALGIDGAAHQACLEAGGRTVAVLGTPIDDEGIYPRTHHHLAHEIMKSGGALVSEYAPGTPGFKAHFPERNRIVVGLSEATLVIEAPFKSGAMITARLALEAGREVWAVPGPITHPNAQGPNDLIRNGATPICGPNDIAHALGIVPTKRAEQTYTEDELKIVERLRVGPCSADAIGRAAGLAPARLAALLTELEMRGVIATFGGGRYTLYT